jgi:amino-acid N-acetyltransferase
MQPQITQANVADFKGVLALLEGVDLPTEGVAEHFSGFLSARDGARIVGCVGLERYGNAGLLRSLAVAREIQRTGLGRELTARVLENARAMGVRDVVLLTTTAADFFARHFGFTPVARPEFDQVFAESPEWSLPRCSSAVCMHLRLED